MINHLLNMDIQRLYELFLAHPVVTTDSRQCPEGSIFFALKGETFDGNQFASKALSMGCSYAVIDEAEYAIEGDDRFIVVEDVLLALQQLANYHRHQLGTRIVGVTGTNGKTTTKELIAAVLRRKYEVLYTQGNFNNHIGVPKTLLQLNDGHDIAVVEMGANHPGEIKTLVNIVEPNYGIITNVGKAHLLGFGSFEGVIRTKGELYDFLRGRQGSKVFINNDNPHLLGIAHDLSLVRYGQHADDALAIEGRLLDGDPFLRFAWRKKDGEWHEVQTQLIGGYNIDNCLAAITIGDYFGVDESDICAALAAYQPSNNRSQLVKSEHNQLIVDAYNANPTSMRAALENFRAMHVENKFVILGAMRELGEVSDEEHQKCVDFIVESGFSKVWLVGEEFASTRRPDSFRLFNHVDEVRQCIAEEHPQGYTILIKGSNSTRLYSLVPEL